MIITRLELDGFAGLSDFRLDLTDGINVFYGANGTGKTTLGLFIRTMLYGVGNDRKRDEVTIRMHIIPIGAQKASGRLIIETDGRRLEIARSFGPTRRHDRIMMTWLDDGSRLQISAEPGEYFFGLNEETFSRTFFVGEMNQAVLPGSTGELTTRLMNLSTTGHENMDYNKAVKKLKDESKGLVNQRGSGSLDELILEKTSIEQKIKTAKQIKEDLEVLKDQIEQDQLKKRELTNEVETLKKKADSFEQLKELEDYGRAMLLLAKKADLEQRIQNIKSPLGLSENSDLKTELEEYLVEESDLEQKVTRHNEAVEASTVLEAGFRADYDRLFHPDNEKVIREFLSAKEALDAKTDLIKDRTPQEINDLDSWTQQLSKSDQRIIRLESPLNWLMVSGLLLFIGVYGLLVNNYTLVRGGLVGTLILVVLFTFKNAHKKVLWGQQEVARKKITDLLGEAAGLSLMKILEADPTLSVATAQQEWAQEYQSLTAKVSELGLQMSDLGDYLREQVQYLTQKKQWQLQLMSISENHQELQKRAAQLEQLRKTLTEKLTPLDLTCDKTALGSLDRWMNQVEIQQLEAEELHRTMLELKKLSEERNLNPILLEPQKYQEQGVRRELDLQRQLISELDRHKEEIAELDIQIVKAQGQLETFQNLLKGQGELPERLSNTIAQITWSIQRHRILELALENLEESYREIQRDYLPRISQTVSETFGLLTNGQFGQVLLTGDYRMKVPLAGELSSMEYLSRGNLDLLWLGLRLSLCAIIMSGEKAPLIFDDSFLHLDEERLKNVLSYLSERIDGQIIILTCHHRETRLLKEMDLL